MTKKYFVRSKLFVALHKDGTVTLVEFVDKFQIFVSIDVQFVAQISLMANDPGEVENGFNFVVELWENEATLRRCSVGEFALVHSEHAHILCGCFQSA